MARYAELYNGTVLEFPDDTPDEVISRVAREQTLKLNPPETPVRSTERTVGEAITDVPVSALSGVGSVLKFPGQLVSLVPGMRGVGEALSAPGEAIYQAAQGLKSEGLKVREALRSEAISEAEKDGILSAFATAITSTLKDPALISTFIGEQLPMLLPPAAAARVAQIGTGTLTAAQVARRGVTAAVGTGAAMQAADISEGAYKRTLEAGLQQGMSPEEAQSAANQAARLAAVGAGATSLLAQRLPGARAIEERLARVPGTSGRLKSGFGEATSESLEEAGGQVFANLGVRTVDPTQSLTEGVGAAAGFGALGGGFFGTLLGNKAPTPLVPGQREGESIEQAVSRLVAERDALRETQLPSGILGGTELTELASRMGDDGRPLGYGLLTNYIEKTALLPDSPAKQQSIEVAESIRQRLNLENIQRQKASQTNIITGKDLMDVGFTPQDPVYRALVGKDLFKPEDAQTVIQALDNERKLDLDSERTALVGQLYEGVSNYLDTLPGSGFYAPERGTDGRGVEVSDQRRPVSETRPPEVDEGGVDSDTTISGGLDVGEEAKQPSLRFMTEKGSFYEVDESGNTARTKLSPGKGQGTTYDPHPVLYVSPENLREIQSDMIGGMGNHTPRLGYRQDFETGSVFKPITSRSEIPEGAEPYVAVVNRNNGNIVGVYPAQLNPEVGLHPVEKLYKDGKSFTHLGNKITELVQDFEIVTPKLLKDLEIDIKSGVAKRVLGKKVEDVLEDLAKAAPSKKSLLGIPEAKFRQLETEAKKEKPIQKVEKEPTEEELSVKQKIEDLNKQIEGLLRQVLNKYGLKDVSLKIVKDMAAKGEFSGRLIKLADDTDNPLLDLRHETIHALKELGFFSPAQWKTLEDRAKKEWIDTYLKKVPHDKTQSRYDAYKNMFESEGLTEEGVEAALIEEAIADAFSFFAKEKAPPGLMNAIKNRMQNLFKALKEFLGTNNLTAEDIFGKIEEGKLPPVVKGKAAEEPKKSLSSGVPRSTRLIMESSTPFAQNELGLRTEKPKGATGANNVRDIAQALNNQTIQNFGGMTREQLSAADANDLARALADEVGYQLRATAQTGTGLGWYSNNYPKAIDRLSARFPELRNNKTARSVFTACVAISSNGEDVTTNIKNAILMYEDVRAGKKIRQIGARRADALQRNKEKVITLLNRYGDNFTNELLKTTTVKEMNAGLRALGEKPDTSYLANTTVPVAAIYFGPKLGAFYANLMGAEGYLTMDMWWTRTMNRMRGLLMPEATQSSINKFQEMIGTPGLTRQQVVTATIPFRNKYEAQGYTTELEFLVGKKEPAKKDELPAWTEKAKLAAGNAYDQLEFEHRLEKMANTIYKNEFEMLQEAPFTGSDRAFMYKVARDAQKILKQEGIDLSLADIQAAIWYYEKRLYAKLSGRLADDIGYDEAISRSVTNNRRARPSLVFPDGPNSGYVPPRRDRDADQVRGKPEERKLSLRSPLGFYSALMDGIQSSPTTTAPAGGWKAQIKGMINKGQVKQDEIEWSNINDYLDLQTGKVSKDDLLNYLKTGGVRVEETTLKKIKAPKEIKAPPVYTQEITEYFDEPLTPTGENAQAIYELSFTEKGADEPTRFLAYVINDERVGLYDDSGNFINEYFSLEVAEWRVNDLSEFFAKQPKEIPRYAQYTLPDGENYKEVLLTLPVSYKNAKGMARANIMREEAESLAKQAMKAWTERGNIDEFNRLNEQSRDLYRQATAVEKAAGTESYKFESKHWDQPNVIAHIRVNDRTDTDGNKVLFVEEIQSDWGQEGKKVGFRKKLDRADIETRIENITARLREIAKTVDETPELQTEWNRLSDEKSQLVDSLVRENDGIIPAPFVTKTEGWLNLALKRTIVMAAEGGYDKVAFVNGEQSADRYDLSKQIEDISYRNNKNGTYAVVATDKNGRVAINKNSVKEDEIEGIFGKEIAQKIVSGEGKPYPSGSVSEGMKKLSGLDLKVGGEGMKAFYNTIVPTAVKKLLPKVGGGQMGRIDIAVTNSKQGQQPAFDVTPEMREKVKKGLPLFSLRPQTQTPAFKAWFGNSKVVDENGDPLVVYHGTKAFDDYGETEGEAISQFAGIPNWFAEEPYTASGYAGAEGTMYPAYLSIKNPLTITTFDMNDDADAAYDLASSLGVDVDSLYIPKDSKAYNVVSTPQFIEAAQNAGYDGIKVKEGSYNTFAAFDPTQIKSAIGNIGTFDVKDPDIRRSIRSNIRSQTPPQILNRIDATIGFRDDVSLPRRMMNAISPRLFSEFRANAINRYNELAELDKRYVKAMGGPQLLADSSAEAAALFSDLGAGLTASALGVHDRVGGVPVFRNGVTVISNLNNTVKGPLAIFEPLAKYGDPEIFRLYQFWASVKRGSRLAANGKVTPFNDPNDVAYARQLEQQYPEFVSVQRDWTKYNDGLVDFMEATGIITPEASTEFKAHGDYFPFYRYAEFDDVTGPRIFASIANVPVPKKLKGGEAPLGDFFENVIRNTQAAIQMGIKNIAAQRATELSVAIGEVTPLPFKPPKITPDVYRVLENGKEKYYRANDILFINAIKSLNIPDLPFIGLLSAPANVLRNLVTKTPDFMMANMLRDSVAAWVTSGKEITPVIATLKNFGTAIAEKSPELTQLRNAGVLGGYDYAQGVEVSGKRFAKDLRKISKTRTDMEKLASPFTSIWEALEKGSAASDAATRMEVYKKTLQETGNEAEALYQALEVMNFNRKGRSAVIRILTAAVPFLNARIQGLDLLYRAGIRPFFDENATDAQMARAKTFWVRGMTIMALSAMYWAAVSDDDDWKKQEQETRDNYWILPEAGIKIPIPFEIGVMFKVVPERILEYSFGDDTGKDFLTSMKRQLVSTFAFNPIPQTFLPIVESATNHSFFTQRPIISQGMEGVAAEYQAMPTTSRAAIGLADGFNSIMDGLPPSVKKEFAVSPIKLEHLIQGYTGSMGTYALQLLDYIIGSNSEIPSAETRFERMPVIRRFLVDPQARGQVTAYYDLKNATDEVVRTSNYLERTANYEDLSRFMSDNYKMLANKDYIRDLEKTMKEFREMKVMIQSSRMSRESKRSALDSIEKMELQLTKNISFLKK